MSFLTNFGLSYEKNRVRVMAKDLKVIRDQLGFCQGPVNQRAVSFSCLSPSPIRVAMSLRMTCTRSTAKHHVLCMHAYACACVCVCVFMLARPPPPPTTDGVRASSLSRVARVG